MNGIRIGNWLLNIDIERTRTMYENVTDVCDCLTCQNFRQADQVFNEEMLNFCRLLRLDLHKPSQLHAFPVEGDQMMYSGYYHICGEIVEGNLDEWDLVVGQHCFSLVQEEGGKPNTLTAPYFQIGFEVVLESMELIKK